MFKPERTKQLSKDSPYTRQYQAKVLELKCDTLTQYLNGHQKPGRDTIINMAKLYGVAVSELDDEIEIDQPIPEEAKAANG